MTTTVRVVPLRRPPLCEAEAWTVIVFGATGDLARRKLLPALYDLQCLGGMHCCCEIIGTGRTFLTDDQFRGRVREAFAESKDPVDTNDPRWSSFEQRLHYIAGDPSDPGFYSSLAAALEVRQQAGGNPNRIFYIATPSSLARPIIEGLGAAGLAKNSDGWSRIVIEKPFGRDLQSGRELNRVVDGVFAEESIFRIDHYLGKETVQNILVFRFGNSIFEPLWNRHYIDHVEITAAETLGFGSRASSYEETGALRDMVTNHLLQLLTLTVMEPPTALDANALRDRKVQLLDAIRPMTVDEVSQRTARGQYGTGTMAGRTAPGYRSEPGVPPRSETETYAAIGFRVDNERWKDVPFYVRTGKRLGRQLTEVVVHFKPAPHKLFAQTPMDQIGTNLITLRIQHDDGIAIAFVAERPGDELRSIGVVADFSYADSFEGKAPSAYGTLLLDVMRGDQTRFTRRDEVDAEWRIITPIMAAWTQLAPPTFPNYVAGSDGPLEVDRLQESGGRRWRPIATAGAGTEWPWSERDDGRTSARVRNRGRAPRSGGTLHALYEMLAAPEWRAQVPWHSVHLFWGDERFVSPRRSAQQLWSGTRGTAVTDRNPTRACASRRDRCRNTSGSVRAVRDPGATAVPDGDSGLPTFDLVLLGLGTDGHTASLFPRSPVLRVTDRLIAAVFREEDDEFRITMTLPLSRVLADENNPAQLPARLMRPPNGVQLWFVDRPAAPERWENVT